LENHFRTVQEEAKDHVRKYQTQREFANKIIKNSREEVEYKLEYKKRNHCITIDMGQNIGLPNFAADQVGDIYYMTPINVFVFGCNDNSRPEKSDQNECLHLT
jgi:hypothetical protein